MWWQKQVRFHVHAVHTPAHSICYLELHLPFQFSCGNLVRHSSFKAWNPWILPTLKDKAQTHTNKKKKKVNKISHRTNWRNKDYCCKILNHNALITILEIYKISTVSRYTRYSNTPTYVFDTYTNMNHKIFFFILQAPKTSNNWHA